MASVIQRVDDFLIDRVYQRIADAIGRRFGKSCYETAAMCAHGPALAFAPFLLEYVAKGEWGKAAFEALVIAVNAATGYVNIKRARDTHRDVFEAERPAMPVERLMVVVRTLFTIFGASFVAGVLVMSLLSDRYLTAVANTFFWASFISFNYFMACTPKPPARQKQKRDLFAWFRNRVPAFGTGGV